MNVYMKRISEKLSLSKINIGGNMPVIKEDVISNILKTSKSEKVFSKALSAYVLTKDNITEKLIIFTICTILSIILGMASNTVYLVTNSISLFLNITLALFGIIFTGYAIFQTLLTNELIVKLFEDTILDKQKQEKSKLQETNENFVCLMMLFVLGIIINIILNILMPVIPENYCLFDNIILCTVLATILIDVLFYTMGIIIWRIVSFIGNIYHLFNAYAVSKLISALKDQHPE